MKSKKVILTTLHRACNFGSVLQVFALAHKLAGMGHSCTVLDYIPYRFRLSSRLRMCGKDDMGNAIKRMIFGIFMAAGRLVERFNFSVFIHRFLPLSHKSFYSFEDVCREAPDADVFITGSDQVWNSEYNGGVDRVLFLDFTSKRRISFAASLGSAAVENEYAHEVRRMLSGFKAVSVRESGGADALMAIGVSNPILLLDPVFLYGAGFWQRFGGRRRYSYRYVLLYQFGNDQNCVDLAREIADKKGIRLVSVSTVWSKDSADRQFGFASPRAFVSLVAHCEFLVTNSFHGTCFSMIFNKQFTVLERDRFNHRIDSLLAVSGLGDRMMDTSADGGQRLERALVQINFAQANQTIAGFRRHAAEFLKENI